MASLRTICDKKKETLRNKLGIGSSNVILLPIAIPEGSLLQNHLSVHHGTNMGEPNLLAKFAVVRNDDNGSVLSSPIRQGLGQTRNTTNVQMLEVCKNKSIVSTL